MTETEEFYADPEWEMMEKISRNHGDMCSVKRRRPCMQNGYAEMAARMDYQMTNQAYGHLPEYQ